MRLQLIDCVFVTEKLESHWWLIVS